MKGAFVVLAAIALCFAATGVQGMASEVDALYSEEAYEPYFLEASSASYSAEEQDAEAFLEVDELEEEAPAAEEAEEAESEEEYAFVEDTPVVANATANATAANTTLNATLNANSTANVTFVPPVNATTYPTTPNPLDPICGCYNGATCQAKVCICSSRWAGQWCERPSPLALGRQTELERLGNLTSMLSTVSRQVAELEASSGSPAAIQRLIADAAQKEIQKINVANAEREFHKALSNNDLFVAREQLNLVKYMDKDKYPILEREFHVQEERIAKQLSVKTEGIKQMEVPVMQEEKYKNVDTTTAKNLKAVTFERANTLVEDAKQQARQFNLDFGDAV